MWVFKKKTTKARWNLTAALRRMRPASLKGDGLSWGSQSLVKKVVIMSLYITIGSSSVSGLLLVRYTKKRNGHRFQFSKLLALYSFIVASGFAAFYLTQIYTDYLSHQLSMQDATQLYCYMNVFVCLLNYVTQWAMSGAIAHFQNSIPLFDTIEFFTLDADPVYRAITLLFFKIITFPVVMELTLLLQHINANSTVSWLHTLKILLPLLLANHLNNCFFGSILLIKVLLFMINKEIKDIIGEVQMLQTPIQMHLLKPYYRMKRFCDLADHLDELIIKYTIATSRSMDYLKLTAFSLVCTILVNFIGITVGFYNQYQAIANHFINDTPFDVFQMIIQFVFMVIPFLEIALIARLGHHVQAEAKSTGVLLQTMDLEHADVRFKQVVRSSWLLVHSINYQLQPLGLFQLNVSLINGIFSAVTSVLLIYIQTDLTLKFSLK